MNLKIKTGESSKKNSLKIAFLLCFLISVQFVFAQNQTIDLNITDKPLSEIFKSIEKQADISVDFDETQINIHQKISVNIKNKKHPYWLKGQTMPYRPTSTDGFTSKPPRNPDWSFHT